MHELTQFPTAWIICTDARLFRFFEIELAHLGVKGVAEPPPNRSLCLVVADTDTLPVTEAIEHARAQGCPLLAFGCVSVELSEEQGTYIRRPFPLPVLETSLRRLTAEATTTASPLTPPAVVRTEAKPSSSAPLQLDDAASSAIVGSHRVSLTPAEWTILRYLYDRRGTVVPRATLAELLEGGGNSVDVYICHLRRKIEKPLGRRMIATVRGAGYRLESET